MDEQPIRALYKDFIGIYENAFSEKFCNDLIKYFEYEKSLGKTWGRRKEDVSAHMRQDTSTLLGPQHIDEIDNIYEFATDGLIDQFHDTFWGKVYPDYARQYPVVDNLNPHGIRKFKIQKTLPSEGYHVWHMENDGSNLFLNRIMAYTVYLNDVEEGGETEFLYQSVRVKPTRGTAIVWPAYYTHLHRGNPPLSGEKYLLTGWIEYK